MRTLRSATVLTTLVLVLAAGTASASPANGSLPIVPVENTDSALCGMTTPRYGTIGVGSIVTLARHAPWTGPTGDPSSPFATADDNWNEQMAAFVGRRAVVVELGGLDMSGCAGVRVDVDEQQWFWRVRDLSHSAPGILRN